MDITDMVVNDPLDEYGENVTIESKLHEKVKEYLKTSDGKYYALPHTQTPTMLTYDADLFDRFNLYFDANGVIGKKSTDSGLSKGVDNVAGTYDDGLPATYKQFFQLCAKMKQRGIAPIIWSGMYEWYTTRFLKQLRVDFDGAEAAVILRQILLRVAAAGAQVQRIVGSGRNAALPGGKAVGHARHGVGGEPHKAICFMGVKRHRSPPVQWLDSESECSTTSWWRWP